MSEFTHPLFAQRSVAGCTTESLRWNDADYHETAGRIGFRPTAQASTTPHLWFADVAVVTNDGREIVLERVEGGKLLDCLLETRKRCTADALAREERAMMTLVNAWAAGTVEPSPTAMLKAQQRVTTARAMHDRTKC